MSLTARDAALAALERFRKSNMRSESALSSVLDSSKMDPRDSALAARIFYSAIQNYYYIDAIIENFSTMPVKKIQPKVMDILRVCISQILFLDRVPDFSAVNEAVATCKKVFPKAASFVNAVCRKVSDNKEKLPVFGKTDAEKFSIKYSHPLWFVERLLREMSLEETEQLLSANNSTPPAYLQCNTLKCDMDKFCDIFSNIEGIVKHPYLNGCVCVENFGAVAGSDAFNNGLFYVQDPAAKMAIMAAAPKTGYKVIDVCAAPGGKSIAAAMLMNGIGEIYSYDIGEKKLPKIIESAKRLGIEIISAEKADGREFIEKHNSSADVVIADVPCSGFGVIRKKPEIRYKDYEEVSGLPEIQLAILKNASSYVKPNGVLLYSTCTVLSEENGDVVSKFLQDNDKFIVEDFEIPVGKSQNGMMTLYPHKHDTDGFFICKLRRVK